MLYVFLGKKFLEYQAYIVERNKFNREFKTIKDKIHTFYTHNFLFLRGTTAPVFLSRRHPYVRIKLQLIINSTIYFISIKHFEA